MLVTGESLTYVKKFSRLKGLLLHKTQATDRALVNVRNLKHLEYFLMWDAASITDKGLSNLKGLSSLKYLHVGNSQITD